MPTPVPTETKAKESTSRPWPCARSARAAASTSFSIIKDGPNAARSSDSSCGWSHPSNAPASDNASRRLVVDTGAAEDGLRDVRDRQAESAGQALAQPAELGDPPAATLGAGAQRVTRPHVTAEVADGAADVLTAHVERQHEPGLGTHLVQHRIRARRAGADPGGRTNPLRSRLLSAKDTVGFDSPVIRASSARESCTAARMWSSSNCSFRARINCGPAGLLAAPVATGVGTRDPVSSGGRPNVRPNLAQGEIDSLVS